MHLPGGELDPTTLIVTGAAAVGAVAAAAGTMRQAGTPPRVGVAVVAGGGVLAAHLAEVPLAGGQTVHLVGAALLALALGPRLAILTMAAALLVESLVWDVGGVLALGANILTMAVLPVLVATAAYRVALGWVQDRGEGRRPGVGWRAAAAGAASFASVIAASVAVVGVLAVGAGRVASGGVAGGEAGAALGGEALRLLIAAHVGWGVLESAITAGLVALALAWQRSRTLSAGRADIHRHVHVLDGDLDRLG